MIYRCFLTVCALLLFVSFRVSAQQTVSCIDNYEDLYPGNASMRKTLDEVCRQTRLQTQEGYTKASSILKSVLDTMANPSLVLMDWKDSLMAAINNADLSPKQEENKVKLGACCFPDFHCEYISEEACLAAKGTWHDQVSCSSIPCSPPPPPPAGACLLPNGECLFLSEAICGDQKGSWKGAGVRCDEIKTAAEEVKPPPTPIVVVNEVPAKTPEPNPVSLAPVWACCPDNPDDECTMTTQEACKSGNWLFGVKCESANCQAIPDPKTASAGEKASEEIPSSEMERLKQKGENKVTQLKGYIDVISDKSTPSAEADMAINSAVSLFDSEERKVTVSSVSTGKVVDRKVRVYFNRLKELNYSQVKIEWANFQYASKFIKGNDGKYYGYVTFEQRFTGYKEGAPVYEDRIERKMTIVISKYQKIIEGNRVDEWDVFLGDMAISQQM